MAVIAVDVDFTVVWLREHYWEWLQNITGVNKPIPEGVLSYDYTSYFKEELEAAGRCGFDYFRQDGLYDMLQPMEQSVEVLQTLSDLGHEIVFVSAIKGRHAKSKYEFLKRNFPFMDAVIYTKEKQYIHSHVFIDDRAENINKSSAPIKILFDAGHRQNEPITEGVKVVKDWEQIGWYLLHELDRW